MPDDELGYDDVIDVWEREKDASQPCALPKNFYQRLRGYIQELEEKNKDIETPPKNKRERMVQKQYERVLKITDHFFKERQKKIVLAAYHRSLGEEVNTENLLDRELELLDDISSKLKELKDLMFYGEYKRRAKDEVKPEDEKEKLEGTERTDKEKSSKEKDKGAKKGGKEGVEERKVEKITSSSEGGESLPEEEKGKGKEKGKRLESEIEAHEEVLVYILEDIPPFVDVDSNYDLRKEDVVTLQENIAQVLIERGKARKVKF